MFIIWNDGKLKDKKELRFYVQERLLQQSKRLRNIKSENMAQQFFDLPLVQKAQCILFYAALESEVNTFPMMERALEFGKRIAVPFVQTEERKIIPVVIQTTDVLQKGAYGISEPPRKFQKDQISPHELDIVVVPGLAFDYLGNRLGRGAGYYDRFIASLSSHTTTIGLAYDVQMFQSLPFLQSHDRRIDIVITNQQ